MNEYDKQIEIYFFIYIPYIDNNNFIKISQIYIIFLSKNENKNISDHPWISNNTYYHFNK